MNKLKKFLRNGKSWYETHRGSMIFIMDIIIDILSLAAKAIITLLTKAITWGVRCGAIVGRVIGKMMLVGIFMNVLCYFYPELPEKIPTIYAIGNGGIVVAEFMVKAGINCLCTIKTGNWMAFESAIDVQLGEMLNQLAAWLTALQF